MAEPNVGTLVGERLGKYELLSLLAVGGTAEIYLARIGGEAGFQKYVVVKCLLDHLAREPQFVDMFLDEARLGAQLDHSNIVQTLELGRQDGRYFLAMEYLAGMSLATLHNLARDRLPEGLPVEQSLALCAQACTGLHYAHERTTAGGQPLDIVHRDVSPQNLVVSFAGVLKLVDFGIAKAAVRKTKTRTGTIKGKFAYMSPEQCLDQTIDRRTDVFALGTVLHELLTGRRLFKRSTTYETYQAIVDGAVPRPSEVNPLLDRAMDDLVLRALAYRPDDRYDTAEAFGEAIHRLMHERGRPLGATGTARFLEDTFAPEVELHAQRMRELASGGPATMQDITWNAPADESDPSLRPESEEPLDFDSPPRRATPGEAASDFDDDQPTRLDPWAGTAATDEPASNEPATIDEPGPDERTVDQRAAQKRVAADSDGAAARNADDEGSIGDITGAPTAIDATVGHESSPHTGEATNYLARSGLHRSKASAAADEHATARREPTDDDRATVERPPRRKNTIPPPIPAAARKPVDATPASTEAGGRPSASRPVATRPDAPGPSLSRAEAERWAPQTASVPPLAPAASPLRWRPLAIGFFGAALVGLLAMSAVLAMF